MGLVDNLENRSANKCELCGSTVDLTPFLVAPKTDKDDASHVYTCSNCKTQLEDDEAVEVNHWRCLNDSMWSEVSAVKVVAYRMLHQLKAEGWPQDLLDMIYMEEKELEWAKDGIQEDNPNKLVHKDSNGAILQAGDSITVIKDLNVKGSSLVAKRGTAVRNITLVHDNAEQIEGRVEGQHIVILTQYVKKNA
ncbi:MAG: PhnA domain-containing protein [Flavobacteriales bacterium]|nr:PhnA domain-containing protein [Flavobacteriales bacterium]